jgi:uncharacterized membrane protein required for colicin V production
VNQVDVLILLVVAASAVSGARRGAIGAGGDVSAVIFGLGLASFAYPALAFPFAWLGLPKPFPEVFGFLSVATVIVFLVGWIASVTAENWELPPRFNRIGGAVLGGVMGVLLASVLVLVSGLVARTAAPIQQSLLGRSITSVVPGLHETAERVGLPLPKLVRLPTDYREEMSGMRQGLQFLRINSTRLDGATCIYCRTPVVFEGYKLTHGTLMSPRFRCPKCGRTSDGCQTFEGFHDIYGACPVDLAREGVQFDCGVWTNGWWTYPHGACPACGKEYLPPPGTVSGRP